MLEARRRRAVELVQRGERAGTVARILGVDRSSVYRWGRQAAATDGLAARPHPHRPPRLNDRQLVRLERLLARGAQAYGWINDLWTAARVATLIQREFQVSYHHDHVGRFLRERLGWTPQKPVRRARERDEDAILRWQSEEFPRIAREAEDRGAHLVFLDKSGFMLTPTARRTWAPRGQTPVLSAWDRRDRISAISSISVSPVARRLNLHFELLPDNANAHGEDVVAYLKKLRATLGGPLTILWDGSRIHDRSRAVQAFLATHPDVRTERLPSYAPELNPDELVWAWTKFGRLGNLAAANTDWLRDYLWTEFEYVKRHPELLASFIDKTHLPLRL
ncbi:IS630-like element ISDra3 family transposase [soil metagenome]